MSGSGELGNCWVLFVVFLALKLSDVLDWSWWWVTAPLWIPLGVAVLIGAASGAVKAVAK